MGMIALLLCCCGGPSRYFPKGIETAEVPVVRFDRALMSIDSVNAADCVPVLYEDYSIFMPAFVEQALGVATTDTAYLIDALPLFLSDTVYGFRQTNNEVARQYADMTAISQQLNSAFGRLHFLYPELIIPTIYTFISGFNASILFLDNGDIGVGLDMYLGSDYPYYNRVVYNYQKQTMRKECIPVDVVTGYMFYHFPFEGKKSRLLENMLYRGKLLFVCNELLDVPPYEVIGYTREQWHWCEQNERKVWNRVMDKRDLFKQDAMVLTSYLNDGPFTAEISQQAPPRIGTWLGWQIVASYMEHHPELSLQELMALTDAEQLLRESRYNP